MMDPSNEIILERIQELPLISQVLLSTLKN
jgi:hypothetical protein